MLEQIFLGSYKTGEFYFQVKILSVGNSIIKLKQTGGLGGFSTSLRALTSKMGTYVKLRKVKDISTYDLREIFS